MAKAALVLVVLELVAAGQPGWFGPDDEVGTYTSADLTTCIANADTSMLTNPKTTTYLTTGFGDPASDCFPASDGTCLTWGATGADLCSKVFGQSCLKMIDGQDCSEKACSEIAWYQTSRSRRSLFVLVSNAVYCNVGCPAGTYHTASNTINAATDAAGAPGCAECLAGKYQPTSSEGTGAGRTLPTSCLDCPASYYSSTRAASCTICPQGKHQPATGQALCITSTTLEA